MKWNKEIIIGLVLSSITYSCGNDSNLGEIETEEVDTLGVNKIDNVEEISTTPNGFLILQSTCFSCHNPDPNSTGNVGPTLASIKNTYRENFDNLKSFQIGIKKFLKDPSAENSIIAGATETFGAMPQMSLQGYKMDAIAAFLFNNSVEDVGWFENEYPKEVEKAKIESQFQSYLDKGFDYAMATKSVLGKNLKGILNSEGSLAAVNFCNLKAVHFTDSMSIELNATIKRVTDKPRNSNNQANAEELAMIDLFKKQLEAGEEIIPTTKDSDHGTVFGYYPIVTNAMCLKCHGNMDEVEQATYTRIKELYTDGKAFDYTANQLRGIWVVEMNK